MSKNLTNLIRSYSSRQNYKSDLSKYDKQIFSGIQPTSIPHLGNYFGAIKQWVDMQNSLSKDQDTRPMIISIVDLHAITLPKDPRILNDYIYKCAATLVSCGIDPERNILYQQSQVAYHGQLSWILGCKVTMPQLGRMHQFKFKSDGLAEVPLGLYTYPVLQAADILLYRATHVPVGEDQLQHLELCRTIADKFNNTYSTNYFPSPIPLQGEFTRLKSLRDPSKKMSKSDADSNSRIELVDPPEIIEKKIKKAVTDSERLISYKPDKRPGLSTLIDLECAVTGQLPEEVAERCMLQAIDKSEYKKHVSKLLIEHLAPIQAKYKKLINDKKLLDDILDDGAKKANKIAEKNFHDICKIIGSR
ncbi:unnamed protein product [Brachionus calyciflorus]|uniref:Tryptophan--tRNA ligase, mitochondrial n=1 Tax=Brachionus calyciflorus TaxID=104777 RepID=A0A813PY76_9BILA|nr:unnamed protein product [Brachionus calyciflorus]